MTVRFVVDFSYYELIIKLNTKNQIIRINTVFKDYSSIKKAIILPRIYHD
ncbi:hypothetical protein EfmAA290_18510 [Enterococcus faecium]|nr:hypothetical protein EfmAA290_18510 [Enterococcus faecium]